MTTRLSAIATLALVSACVGAPAPALAPPAPATRPPPLRIVARLAPSLPGPLDGRLLVLLAPPKPGEEPRARVSDSDDSAQVFGVDIEGLRPGASAVIDGAALGYPVPSLRDLPPGTYEAQAVVHRYETFQRADGHTVKLPPDRGEGQSWAIAPGNPMSAPITVRVDPAAGGEIHLEIDRTMPELPPVADTKYVKHVRLQSERLTRFWGRPTFLGATVLLPEGWDSHPNARYPLAINHGHFAPTIANFREAPADPALPPVDLEGLRRDCPNGHEGDGCKKHGYERLVQEQAHAFYELWTGSRFPRVLLVDIQHANPYYDDSYAVNSENVGPYGDAITYELVPYLEKQLRGLGPWARGVFGGSTGGWESLAVQLFYPEEYNGAIVNCPDPIDFHAYMSLDLYTQKNAYYSEGPFRRTARPGERDYLGQTRSTIEQQNLKELVLGTHSRSGGQWDIWQAVFSPVATDGYPRPIWDKRTGVIDPEVARYWREHYDLVALMKRDWARLGPLVRGKLTINVGLSDNFFLNDAVYLAEDFLKTAQPPADAVIAYGQRDEHCWSGDATTFNGVSRLTYFQRFLPKLAEHWRKTAPKGADTTSWR